MLIPRQGIEALVKNSAYPRSSSDRNERVGILVIIAKADEIVIKKCV